MIKKNTKDLYFLALLGGLIFLPFAPLIFGNWIFIDSGMVYNDITSFYFSLRSWYKAEVTAGRFPFWTDLVGNGYPVFAEGQLGAFYPLNFLLYYFLPVVMAFNISWLFHFWLAGFGTFAFARISLNLSRPAALLAGLIYALSGFFFGRISYIGMISVVAYFPLNLLLAERIAVTGKIKHVFLLALVFAVQIFIGHFEMFFYCLFFSFLFFFLLVITGRSERGRWWQMATAAAAAILIAAAQLIPTYELVGLSHRAGGFAFEASTASDWPLRALLLFILPRAFDRYTTSDFSVPAVYGYISLVGLVLALLAGLFLWRRREVAVFLVIGLLAFLWAQGRLSPVFAILWEIVPPVKYFRAPIKLLFALEFSLAVLAAVGFDYWREKLSRVRPSNLLIVILFNILIVGIIYGDLFYHNSRFPVMAEAESWFAQPEAALFLKEKLDPVFQQIYSHGTNNIDFATSGDVPLQKSLQNILPPNLNLVFRLPANRENFALFLKTQQALNRTNTVVDVAKGVLRLPPELKQSLALQGASYFVTDIPVEDGDLALVREIFFSRPVDHLAPLTTGGTARIKVDRVYIYLNRFVFPRLLVTERATNLAGKSEEEILEAVLNIGFDPRKELIIKEGSAEEKNPPMGKEAAESQALISLRKYEESHTEMVVKSEKPAYLVLARTYYPGWRAQVDGRPAEIFRANYAFQAVKIPAGEHLIELEFKPTGWSYCLLISGGALVSVLLGLAYGQWKNR